MTRNEYEEIETVATVALAGLLSRNNPYLPDSLAFEAFEIAQAFQKERLKRIGEKPGFDD